MRRPEAWLRVCQNGETTVAPLRLPSFNPHPTENAKLRSIDTARWLFAREEPALLAAADPGMTSSPVAPVAVAVKIAAAVQMIERRVECFAKCGNPRLPLGPSFAVSEHGIRRTPLRHHFFRVRDVEEVPIRSGIASTGDELTEDSSSTATDVGAGNRSGSA